MHDANVHLRTGLDKAAKRDSSGGRKAALAAIVTGQHFLVQRFGAATEQARIASRVIARTQIKWEVRAVNHYIQEAGTDEQPLEQVSAEGGAQVDAAAGHQTGMSMAAAWGQSALAALHAWRRTGADPASLPSAALPASPSIEHRVERHAVTQALDAYNDEIRHVWKRLALDDGDGDDESEEGLPYGWRHATFRVWSAILDRKTCKRCFALDGDMVPVGKDFDGGATAPLHPLCRCDELTVVIPEAVQKKLPGVQIDYRQLKADVKDYFMTEDLETLGRRHIGDYLEKAVTGARAKTSPETLLSKFHSRDTRGYLDPNQRR